MAGDRTALGSEPGEEFEGNVDPENARMEPDDETEAMGDPGADPAGENEEPTNEDDETEEIPLRRVDPAEPDPVAAEVPVSSPADESIEESPGVRAVAEPPLKKPALEEPTPAELTLAEPAPAEPTLAEPGLVELTNACLRESSRFLMGAGGYRDDASPDCVRVFFGLAGEDAHHAVTACQAALDLRERLERKFASSPSLDFGIALNTGFLHAGVFETGKASYFTGVGSDVDFTKRLSAANQTYGTRILLGAGTHQRVTDAMEVRPIDMLFVPEDEVMLEVCELLAPAGSIAEDALERRDAFWKGVISYREGDHAAAAGHFENADPGDGSDIALNYYRRKVEEDLRDAHAAGSGGNQKRPRRSHARLANTI